MSWSIEYSKDADKFLIKNPQIQKTLIAEIKKFIRKLNGETVNINFKKLHGEWSGYYRIRKGDVRIIFTIINDTNKIIIFSIDFRGDVYK